MHKFNIEILFSIFRAILCIFSEKIIILGKKDAKKVEKTVGAHEVDEKGRKFLEMIDFL